MGNFSIEECLEEAQVEAVRGLFLEYAQFLNVSLCFQHFEEELRELPGAYGPPLGGLWIARGPQGPSGCVGLRPGPEGMVKQEKTAVCEMKRLYVKPAFRGHGLGRRLAWMAIQRAKAAGFQKMVLDTLESLRQANRLYESFGFRPRPPYYANPLPGVRYFELDLQATPGDGKGTGKGDPDEWA